MEEKDNSVPIEETENDLKNKTEDNPALSSDPIIKTDVTESVILVKDKPTNLEKELVKELQKSYQEYNNLSDCLKHLLIFEKGLNKIDINNLINRKNFEYLKAINKGNNIKMYLTLGHIYSKILNCDQIYASFSNEKEIKEKVRLLIDITNECIKVLEHLKNFPISFEFYDLKKQILDLSKYIYINYKNSLEDEQKDCITQLLAELPKTFYSDSYNEMLKLKKKLFNNNYELINSIKTIETLFFNLNSYYEQLDMVELMLNNVSVSIPKISQNYVSISVDDIDNINVDTNRSETINLNNYKSNEFKEYNINDVKSDEENETLISYGEFLLKLCIYQKIKLVNKDKTQEKKSNKNGNENNLELNQEKNNVDEIKDEEINSLDDKFILVLIDAVKNVGGRIQKSSNENIDIHHLLKNKKFISLYDKKNLYKIIEKNFDNFKELTKNNYNQKIISIKDFLTEFMKLIREGSYVLFDMSNLESLELYDNFSLNKFTVKDGESEYYYIETPENSKCLFIIEFELTDPQKDILFRINKYDDKINGFKIIYDTGRINKNCKIFLYCEEYSIYQLEFNNEYSWINEKEINFKVTSIKIEENVDLSNNEINTNVNNSSNIFENDYISNMLMNNEKIIKYYCHLDDQNFTFNCNKIFKKIYNLKNDNLKDNVPVNNKDIIITALFYLNNLLLITFDDKKNILYKKETNSKEEIISKYFFNKIISKYLNDLTKNNPDLNIKSSKIIINIFSLNSYLTSKYSELNEILTALKTNTINNDDQSHSSAYGRYIQSISFYPDSKIYGNFVSYNLYNFCDQCLIYHLFLCHCKEKIVESSTVFLLLDAENIYVSSFSEGAIFYKFKGLENNWEDRYYSKLNKNNYENIIHFIESINDSFDGLDLALCYMNSSNDNDRKDEKECFEMFNKIKKHCMEKIDPPINVYIYNENELISEVVNYIGVFYEE